MNDLILPYLFGTVATAVVLFLSVSNYVRGKKERIAYEKERALLPDAVRLEKLQELRQRAEDDYEAIQERLSNSRILIAERDDAEKWLEVNRDKLLQLKAEREEQESVRVDLDNLREKVRVQNEKINEQHAVSATVKAELDYSEKIKSHKEHEIQDLEARRIQLLQVTAKLETELQPLQIKLAGIQSSIDAKIKELELISSNMEKRISQYEQRIKSDREERENLQRELENLRENIRLQNEKIYEQHAALTAAKTDLDYVEKSRNQTEAEIEELKAVRSTIIQEISNLEKDLQPLQIKLAGIQSNIDAKIQELELISSNMEKRISQYEHQINQNKEILEKSDGELGLIRDQLTNATNELHAVRDERSRLSADVQAMEREKVALEDLIKNLRADWNTVLRLSGQDEGADERRTQELWVPYIGKKATEFKFLKAPSELDLLSKTDNYLRGKKLYFPQRVLWAFHTSLKVTDISPLVVLAGISGTGKSELPRRYAEAMGLHFLNVAVQPRWDSPQDMFGFFNYLENRYRATELGRALVQMDPYYEEQERGWSTPKDWGYSLSSQMLLVLLDEMNLARVEYYFSEFLSRLETRRGVSLRNSQSRRKAEIGLEVGSGKSSSPIMQLFVDRNVFFVGTMNEDETTQALSDKVIDRANVLRFGRPGRVEQTGPLVSTPEVDSRIKYSDWQSWCKLADDLPEHVKSTVQAYVDRLDDAMSQIKRPFGFRTRNGILSYVANYPSRDIDAVDDAIADQIEQKILPKFRGLDPRDQDVKSALLKVRGVLDDLKDELLVEAIDRTAKESQFVWLGVNRFAEQMRDELHVTDS